jgi:hypothetical protein
LKKDEGSAASGGKRKRLAQYQAREGPTMSEND